MASMQVRKAPWEPKGRLVLPLFPAGPLGSSRGGWSVVSRGAWEEVRRRLVGTFYSPSFTNKVREAHREDFWGNRKRVWVKGGLTSPVWGSRKTNRGDNEGLWWGPEAALDSYK